MTTQSIHEWQDTNKIYLLNALEQLRSLLEVKIKNLETDPPVTCKGGLNFPIPPTLKQICTQFNLSVFEGNILLLCAGMELDGGWGLLCAKAQGDLQKPYPTFSLALSTLPNPHWNALIPTAPLRKWRFLELGDSNSITQSQLFIDEQIVHYLTGIFHLDERLLGLVESIESFNYLVPTHQTIAQKIVNIWTQKSQTKLPIIQLCGLDGGTKRGIIAEACQHLKLNLYSLSAEILPNDINQINLIQCLLEREWLLNQRVFILDCDYLEKTDSFKEGLIAHFLEKINCPIFVSSRERRFQRERTLVTLDIDYPTSTEQQLLWQSILEDDTENINGQIKALVTHFNLNSSTIFAVNWQLKSLGYDQQNSPQLSEQIWEICRIQSRPRLEELAQRIQSEVTWNDLILPPEEQEILREIAAHVRQRLLVYEDWGFKKRIVGV